MKVTFNSHEYEIQDAHPAANCLPWNLDKDDFSDLIESVRTKYDPEKPVIIQQSTGWLFQADADCSPARSPMFSLKPAPSIGTMKKFTTGLSLMS